MKGPTARRSAYAAHVAFGAAALAMVAIGQILFRGIAQAERWGAEVAYSERILELAHTLEEKVARAESALRGQLLGGDDERYLREHRAAVEVLAQTVAQLGPLVADDPVQAARARDLEGLVGRRIAIMEEVAARFREGGLAAARRHADAAGGSAISLQIYDAAGAMRHFEATRRQARQQARERRDAATRFILGLAMPVTLVVMTLAYLAFLRQARARGKAEKMLTDLAESVPGALFRFRQVGHGQSRYEFMGRDVAGLLGAERAEALAKPSVLLRHVLEEDRPAFLDAVRRAAARPGQFDHEFRVRAPDGRIRWLRSTALLRARPDGSVLWNGYWSDVTARKEAELTRDSFFTLSLDLQCIAGADGYFKIVNPAFTQTLGWSAEELLARPFFDFIHPEDVAATVEVLQRAGAGPLLEFENRYRHKDGSWRVLSWRSSPSAAGEIYATARDVTEAHRVREALVAAKDAADAASRAKSTFVATMSHEIRTPLNGVLGMLELLGMGRLDQEQRAMVDVVRKSGESLKRIIDDILEFSRIEAGRLAIHPEPASIAGVVAAVRDVHSGVASSKGLVLEHRVDDRISPALKVDALRLQQILNNFVSNALKFTAAGRVTISAELAGRDGDLEHVRFTVADTGVGIPAHLQRGLFQPFAQAEGDTNRRFGGTGLGLAISRRLADLLGGRIGLHSEPGQGTRVELLLPMTIVDPATLPPPQSPAFGPLAWRQAPGREQALAEGTLILVVDDHPTNRALLARQLQVLGYACETAADGAQALAAWERTRFGLVMADCHMPVMDGYAFARRVRDIEARRGLERTPIVACTANALRGEAEVCIAAGMDDYVAKPVRLADLQAKIARWLPLPEEAGVGTPPISGDGPAEPGAPIDRSVLAVVCGGATALEREVLRDFRRAGDGDVAALRQAVGARDRERIRALAHRMKGSSATVGATHLSRVCEALEQDARDAGEPALDQGLQRIEDEIRRVKAYIGTG
jgi:PAS domain S-box-containing protein